MHVLIAGLGRFGGGLGALRYFAEQGNRVRVCDRASADSFADVTAKFSSRDEVSFHFGPERPELLDDIDLLVPSPALPDDHILIREARARGVRIAGEIELFLERCPTPVLAVTGSNGKTTTAHLLAEMLNAAGHPARLAGNMGISLLPVLDELDAQTTVVVELSSFQLERFDLARLRTSGFSLRGAIVTSFAPNHLDRHRTVQAYAEAKARLFELLDDDAPLIFEGSSPTERSWRASPELDGLRIGCSMQEQALLAQLAAFAPHRVAALNATQATLLGEALGLFDRETAAAVLRSFRPLPHRLEIVAEDEGLTFVNDSKSTTPEATAAGVAAFDGPVHLIAGGYDKALDQGPLIKAARRCASVRLLGQTAAALAEALSDHPDCEVFPDLDRLLDDVALRVDAGVVLLSPGHASYGLWRDYRGRGESFRDGVAQRWCQTSGERTFDSTAE